MSAPSTDPESLQRRIGTGRRRPARGSRAFDRPVGCGRFSLQVIVEERGDWIIPGKLCRRRRRTGYSVLYVSARFGIGSLLRNTPYDPVKDFSPVSLVAISPDILVVHPSLPVSSVKELSAWREPGGESLTLHWVTLAPPRITSPRSGIIQGHGGVLGKGVGAAFK
jgi:hypothetical protein